MRQLLRLIELARTAMFSWRKPDPEAERLDRETARLRSRVARAVSSGEREIKRKHVLDSYAAQDGAVAGYRNRGVL